MDTSKKDPVANVNVLLVDPFNDKPQIATFKSTKSVELSAEEADKENDIIVKCIMYNTKANKDDKNYDVKVLVQHPGIYSVFKVEDNNKPDDAEDDYYSESS